jgi:hypothetical protein
MAKAWVNDRNVHLGDFADEAEAARAYNRAARKYHKKRAYLNVVDSTDDDGRPRAADRLKGLGMI